MTSRKSFFGAILGVALLVDSQLAPPALAQGTQPATAAHVKESETERLSRRLNAEIDRRDGRVSSKRSPAEQTKYDRELAKENELLQKSGREAGERYRAEVRASQARSAEEKRERARALGINPPPAKGM